MELTSRVRSLAVCLAVAIVLAACGGGGGGSSPSGNNSGGGSSVTYSVGGTLSGLVPGHSITVANNGADATGLSANGTFAFPTHLTSGSTYALSIVTQPATQSCSSTFGAGVIAGANVGNINLICGPSPAGTFVFANNLVSPRSGHTITSMQNGQALVAGGISAASYSGLTYLSSAEIFDPITSTWSATGNLTTARSLHTATRLTNGKILVVGGTGTGSVNGPALASAELYDPGAGTWSSGGSMAVGRFHHSAVLLANGKVLVSGGSNYTANTTSLASSEIYDPATNSWTLAGSLTSGREGHSGTLLPNGNVLVAGGEQQYLISKGTNLGAWMYLQTYASAEIYDASTNLWSSAGTLAIARFDHTATLLSNGKVIVAGGTYGSPINSTEIYDSTVNIWTTVGPLISARTAHTATEMASGKVMVVGGGPSTAELFDPTTNSWFATGSPAFVSTNDAATLLASGKALVVGGGSPSGILASAEFYW